MLNSFTGFFIIIIINTMPLMCCNPLQKQRHIYGQKQLRKVTATLIVKFKDVAKLDLNMHICDTCRRTILAPSSSVGTDNQQSQFNSDVDDLNVDRNCDDSEKKLEIVSQISEILVIDFSARDFRRYNTE